MKMHEHLTRELFRAIASGWRNGGDLAAIALAHLFELCPDCRAGFESWRREVEANSTAPEAADYDAVIDRIRARVEEAPGRGESQVRSEIREARSRSEELLRLAPEQQVEWIRFESERLRGPLLAEVLIDEGHKRTPGYPRDGYTLASLARLVLHHLPTSLRATALYSRSLAHMANSIRVIGDLPRADQLLADARYFLRSQGGGDRLVRAELNRLEGSLRMDQDHPEEAIPLLLSALLTYRMEGAESEGAAVLIKLALAHRRLHDPARALLLLAEAEKVLEPEPEPWLSLTLLNNRAWCLCLSGDPEVARQVLERGRELAQRRDDPINDLRRLWTRGLIAQKLTKLELAERCLVSVHAGFACQRMKHDTAQAALALGDVYLEQGRRQEAEGLAEEALPVFKWLGLPVKAAAARGLKARAARL